MKRIMSVAIGLAFIFMLLSPAQAIFVYKSGDLAVKALDKRVGAMFRDLNVSDERYIFFIPFLIEFSDNDGSGNYTDGDTLVAIAILKHLSLTVNVSGNNIELIRYGDVRVIDVQNYNPLATAHVSVYLEISNNTINTAKRGIDINRPVVNSDDLLGMIVVFKAVDPQMHDKSCTRKHEKRDLMIQQRKTRAEISYEHECFCDNEKKNVSVSSFSRTDQRNHHFSHFYSVDGHVATQVVFPIASHISYDPTIKVENLSQNIKALATKIAGIIAVLLVIAAIAVVLRNHKQ